MAPAIADSEGTFHDDSMLELKPTRLDPKPFVFRISTIRFSRSVRALVLTSIHRSVENGGGGQ